MGHTLYSQFGAILLLCCCGFAWWKGSHAERWGSSLILGTNICADIFNFLWYPNYPYFAVLSLDVVLAVGLLILAVRFSSLWLGVAMLLQGGELAWYAMNSFEEAADRHAYAHLVNIVSTLMLISMVAGTVASWRRRVRARAAVAAHALAGSAVA